MPYLERYQNDVFVSYAHGPKIDSFKSETDDLLGEWSRQLVRDLNRALIVKLGTKAEGRQVTIWGDPALQGNHPLSDTLKERVENSALLLVIMSPYYLQSEWCEKEATWFANAAAPRGGAGNRIFVVRALWTDPATWPPLLKDSMGEPRVGYSFLPSEDEDADPFGYPPAARQDQDYADQVKRLARDMARELKQIEAGSANCAVVAPTQHSVFLGFMGETLEEDRAQLRDQLTARGTLMFPPIEEEPVDQDSLHVTIDTYLRKAEALVLMASEYPGLWPKDQDGGFISYQIQKAKEFRKACYLWLRVDDLATIRKAPYRNYLQTLSKQAEQAHLVLRFPNVDAFVTHIHDSLHTSPALDPGVEQLAVVCSNLPENEEVGQNFREMVREALRDINREIFIFDFANNRERVKLKHLEDRIRDADTVLVLCFDQQWDWARPLIHEINGFRNLRTGHKAKLLIAGPQDRHAGLYDAGTFGFKTLDGVHIGAERLKQMLKQEILKPALVEGRVP